MTRARMIGIGDELLDGRVRDRNIAQAGASLAERGLALGHVCIVPDDLAPIRAALVAASVADVVIVSGGLGPTADDITRDAAAALLGVALVEDAGALERMRARMLARGYAEPGANNLRQCAFPEGAEVLPNEVGTASGFCVEVPRDGASPSRLYFLPGVPSEFRWMLEHHVLPTLSGHEVTRRRTLHLFGLPESRVEQALDGIEPLAATLGGRVGYRASFPFISVTLKAPQDDALEQLASFAHSRLARHIVGEDEETLRDRLKRLLLAGQHTVTTAESCTAGGIAAALTDLSGSSAWFHQGYVTYANEAKRDLVGVTPDALASFGAVSPEVVCQMAHGARLCGARDGAASFGLAVSGIAGPGGATPTKPVGTVHFALAAEEGVWHHHALFQGRSRAQVRALSVETALWLLLARLEGRLGTIARGPHPIAAVTAAALSEPPTR